LLNVLSPLFSHLGDVAGAEIRLLLLFLAAHTFNGMW
jgi:hypothetical protein